MTDKRIHSVMVSSTFYDLEHHRDEVIKVITGEKYLPIAMEFDASIPDSDLIDSSIKKVDDADYYVGLIGSRYGQCPECEERNPLGLSLTELEFRHATKRGLPTFVFIINDQHQMTQADVIAAWKEGDESRKKREAFIKRAQASDISSEFVSVDDLKFKVAKSLTDFKKRSNDASSPGQPSTKLDNFWTNSVETSLDDVQLQEVSAEILNELKYLDQDFDFKASEFTPLNAEVTVTRSDGKVRKVDELLPSIEKDVHTKLFLVIGDPGSGKSVAMRALARRGLDQISVDDPFPIYVNLKSWVARHPWTDEALPTLDDFQEFLSDYLRYEHHPIISPFFEEHLSTLHSGGKIFWIFDSFDEIPGILDAQESSDVIKHVSRLISRFVSAGKRETSRAIIASRPTRSPILPDEVITRLEIRPFSDSKIVEAFRKKENFPLGLVDTLFEERPDLVPLARTPFYHGLISEFCIVNKRLPVTQTELFDSFIENRIRKTVVADSQALYSFCRDLAFELFDSATTGLEAPLSEIETRFAGQDVSKIIDLLCNVNMMRKGRPPSEMISFSHRRIQEYFVVQKLVQNNIPFDLEWVAQDNRRRDMSVLMVELMSEDQKWNVAQLCWNEIEPGFSETNLNAPKYRRALNCSRFLVSAFRARSSDLRDIEEKIGQLILRAMPAELVSRAEYMGDADRFKFYDRLSKYSIRETAEVDIVKLKHAVELVGLLSRDRLLEVSILALEMGDSWIEETVINACRFQPSLSEDVMLRIWRSIVKIPGDEFRKRSNDLGFLLELSPSLREIKETHFDKKVSDIRSWYRWRQPVAVLLGFLTSLLSVTRRIFSKAEAVDAAGFSSLRQELSNPFEIVRSILFILLVSFLLRAYFGNSEFLADVWFKPFLIVLSLVVIFELTSCYVARRKFPLYLSPSQAPRVSLKEFWGRIARFVFSLLLVWALIGGYIGLLLLAEMYDWATLLKVLNVIGVATVAIGAGFVAVSVMYLGIEFLRSFLRSRKSRKLLKDMISAFPPSDRQLVAKQLSILETEKSRLDYVMRLEQEKIGFMVGDWPFGVRPNFGDEASSRLARLDEKWLGLDRA